MPSEYFRVGLIVPASNTVMEPDFHRQLGTRCAIGTDRMFQVNVTRESEVTMLEEEFPHALRSIKTTAPHVIVFGCTSAGSLGGLQHDVKLGARIQEQTGAHGVTVVTSVVEQLRAIAPQKVAIFTPYHEDLTKSVAECVVEAGYQVVKTSGMGMVDNLDIGKVTPGEILSFVERQMNGVSPDCIFLSCTNWQAVDAISQVKARFGLPVVSSNQATIDAVRRLLGEWEAD
jgi:maleate isomerase